MNFVDHKILLGFVVRDYKGHKGQFTVVHLLNQCGTGHSSIYAQGLMNFFMDDLYKMDYEINVPTPEMQNKILAVLNSPLKTKLHDAHYSMLAYPYSTKYQNSNQWILEVLASAVQGAHSRPAAEQVLAKTGYRPDTIKVDGLSKLGASLFKKNIRFDDHPSQERRQNEFSIVSVNSVIQYLKHQQGLLLTRDYL